METRRDHVLDAILDLLIVQDGVIPKDFTVVQGSVLVIATMYVLVNAAVDLSYFALDPRIRRGRF